MSAAHKLPNTLHVATDHIDPTPETGPTPQKIAALTAAIAQLQAEYSKKIQDAAMSGDMAKVQELAAEMTARIQIMQKNMLTPEPEPENVALWDTSLCDLDLALTVYDGDRDGARDFMEDTHFMQAVDAILSKISPHNARKELLKTALKLTPTLAPRVHAVLDRCRKNIGLKSEIEIYVCPDVTLNAFCWPPKNGKMLVGVTSAMIEKFDEDELCFVIGHEIGHALFNHSRFPAKTLLTNDESGMLSPLHAMKLYAWKRNAEISADRVGLLCSRNFDAAARAFFKLSSGVTTNSLHFEIKDYIQQFSDLAGEVGDNSDPEDWYSTHPFSPMRVKALNMFWRSETWCTLSGQDPSKAEMSEEQLEAEIKKFMSIMEPAYLSEDNEHASMMRDFVLLGGWLVAASNGKIEDSEIAALGSLLDQAEVSSKMEQLRTMTPASMWEHMGELSQKLNVFLPVVGKLNVIKDLTVIAGADGNTEDSERETLYNVCNLLHIRTEFVDHVLSGIVRD